MEEAHEKDACLKYRIVFSNNHSLGFAFVFSYRFNTNHNWWTDCAEDSLQTNREDVHLFAGVHRQWLYEHRSNHRQCLGEQFNLFRKPTDMAFYFCSTAKLQSNDRFLFVCLFLVFGCFSTTHVDIHLDRFNRLLKWLHRAPSLLTGFSPLNGQTWL